MRLYSVSTILSVLHFLCARKRKPTGPDVQRERKKTLNPSILCLKLLLYLQWVCIGDDGRIKTAQSTRILHIIIAFNSHYYYVYTDWRIHTRTSTCVCVCLCAHMSTSDEYFYCNPCCCSLWIFSSCCKCHFLSIVSCFFCALFYPPNEIIILCKGWHSFAHSLVQYHNLNSNTLRSHDVRVCASIGFFTLCSQNEKKIYIWNHCRFRIWIKNNYLMEKKRDVAIWFLLVDGICLAGLQPWIAAHGPNNLFIKIIFFVCPQNCNCILHLAFLFAKHFFS